MGGIIQNCTCLTGLAMAGKLSASPQNKEPVCFSIKWCWQLVFCFFSVLYLEGLFWWGTNHWGVKAEVKRVQKWNYKAVTLVFWQGAERKMRDEERKRVKRRPKNVADSTNSGTCHPSCPLTSYIITQVWDHCQKNELYAITEVWYRDHTCSSFLLANTYSPF